MKVSEPDWIASMKLRIQDGGKDKGSYTARKNQQKKKLPDSILKDYGFSDGNVMHLALRLSDLLGIFIKTAYGKVLEFPLDKNKHVKYLKQLISYQGNGIITLDGFDFFSERDGHQENNKRNSEDKEDVIHLLVQKSAAKIKARHVENDIELSIVANKSNGRGVKEESLTDKEAQSEESKPTPEPKYDYLLELFSEKSDNMPSYIRELVDNVHQGLKKGHSPSMTPDGCGGTYLLPDSSGQKYVGVFKPTDEEPMAFNNPRGLPVSTNGEGMKRGTRVGEGAVREVAVWALDHPLNGQRYFSRQENGFSGVPASILIRCMHKNFNYSDGFDGSEKNIKLGSIQKFVENLGTCEDFGPQAFPVEEVHKISVLDIRVANTDRHAGNILLTKSENGKTVLVPIDHGYCLPENFEDCTFEWLNWPQAKLPYSPETVTYIESLDVEEDIKHLKSCGWDMPPACVRTLRISTMLLQKGIEHGLTPYAIGSIMCRDDLDKESVLEEIVREGTNLAQPGSTEEAFMEAISRAMDQRLKQLMASKSSH
uniref:1-phosphatidylinositol 4-kinase n=1 Tax=Kalanchoe fedtschenkoi TaxID=63787 RepID=A0A7N0R9V0_KALFE